MNFLIEPFAVTLGQYNLSYADNILEVNSEKYNVEGYLMTGSIYCIKLIYHNLDERKYILFQPDKEKIQMECCEIIDIQYEDGIISLISAKTVKFIDCVKNIATEFPISEINTFGHLTRHLSRSSEHNRMFDIIRKIFDEHIFSEILPYIKRNKLYNHLIEKLLVELHGFMETIYSIEDNDSNLYALELIISSKGNFHDCKAKHIECLYGKIEDELKEIMKILTVCISKFGYEFFAVNFV